MSKEDSKLDRLFRSLPRERASEDFTMRFLIRYRDRKQPFRRTPRLVMEVAAATAAVAVFVTSVVWHQRQAAERGRMEAELAAIRQEYLQLVSQQYGYRDELIQLAVLRLGGVGDSEIVIDLSDIDRFEPLPAEGRAGGAKEPLFQRGGTDTPIELPLIAPGYSGGTI